MTARQVLNTVKQLSLTRKIGDDYWGLCPFHPQKVLGFRINMKTERWHCDQCRETGTIKELHRRLCE